jgi:hypothetical protein
MRRLCMHGKFMYVPAAFNGSNVACIKVLLDLISVLIHNLHCGSIMAFVNIFMDIFDRFNRRADFNIDVTVVSERLSINQQILLKIRKSYFADK